LLSKVRQQSFINKETFLLTIIALCIKIRMQFLLDSFEMQILCRWKSILHNVYNIESRQLNDVSLENKYKNLKYVGV